MMRREASWLGSALAQYSRDDLDPILSVGSGTAAFRATFQPWIEPAVYRPLAARGVTVLHHEMEPAEGIDVVGDLANPIVRNRLAELGVRTVLCLNVFEHVLDRDGLAQSLLASVPRGGLVVVTVPRRFPYHADPIDTLFRPDPSQLAALFDGHEIVDSGTVTCESLASHWLGKPGKLNAVRKALRRGRGDTPSVTTDSSAAPSPASPGPRELVRMAAISTEVSYVIVRRAGDPPTVTG